MKRKRMLYTMKVGIIGKIMDFCYFLFALSVAAVGLSQTAAIILLIASLGTFISGGFLCSLCKEHSSPSNRKNIMK